jgi:hypothetical protein
VAAIAGPLGLTGDTVNKMIDLAELAHLFDQTLFAAAYRDDSPRARGDRERIDDLRREGPWPWRATAASRALIEERIGAALPDALVEFADLSVAFPQWFAALGDAWTAADHLLSLRARTRRIRRRKEGRWQYIKPASLIPINRGHDDDFDCLDLSRPSCVPGEFEIGYWSPPATAGIRYHLDFRSYVLSHVVFWSRPGTRRDEFSAGLHRRAQDLQAQQADVLERLYLAGRGPDAAAGSAHPAA